MEYKALIISQSNFKDAETRLYLKKKELNKLCLGYYSNCKQFTPRKIKLNGKIEYSGTSELDEDMWESSSVGRARNFEKATLFREVSANIIYKKNWSSKPGVVGSSPTSPIFL